MIVGSSVSAIQTQLPNTNSIYEITVNLLPKNIASYQSARPTVLLTHTPLD